MALLTVKAAQRRITKIVHRVGTEFVPLQGALGRVLATDVKSIESPQFDNSSVDGFAVRSQDIRRATRSRPAKLHVVTDIPAGTSPRAHVRQGEAARIMTGAPIPSGADAVVMLEDSDQAVLAADTARPSDVRIVRSAAPGVNIRRQGSDSRAGRTVLSIGTVLRPQDLGFLAMLGQHRLRVFRQPLVALLSSGNELLPISGRLQPGKIRDTNSTTLAALLVSAGCRVLNLGIARDSSSAIEARLRRAVEKRANLIITSAGVSVGALDLVRSVIEAHGQLHFWRVNVRPGKPLAVGKYRGIPFIGLPGNPVSAFMGFELFARPAICRLAGRKLTPRRFFRARLAEPLTSDGRESYLRGIVEESSGGHMIRLTGHQGSSNLLSLIQADALLVVPPGVKSLPAGAEVKAWLL